MINILKRKETDDEIRSRILKKCKQECPGDFPTMDAQTALNELSKYLLGEDFYISEPLSDNQVNPLIVYEIERKYKKRRIPK